MRVLGWSLGGLLLAACAAGQNAEIMLISVEPTSPADAGADALAAPPPPSFSRGDAEAGSSDPAGDVDVVLTADNAYAFGWGDRSSLQTFQASPPTTVAGDIFNCPIGVGPEAYTIPGRDAPPTAYLYVVAWADRATTQGVIGQFKRRGAAPILTGDGKWEVCATGVEYISPSAGPTQAVVNQQITVCNLAAGDPQTTSAGWVNEMGAVTPGAVGRLVFGEDNSSSAGDFPIVCPFDPSTGKEAVPADARWMWYSADGSSPFRYVGPGNTTRAFLVFRLPATALPPPR